MQNATREIWDIPSCTGFVRGLLYGLNANGDYWFNLVNNVFTANPYYLFDPRLGQWPKTDTGELILNSPAASYYDYNPNRPQWRIILWDPFFTNSTYISQRVPIVIHELIHVASGGALDSAIAGLFGWKPQQGLDDDQNEAAASAYWSRRLLDACTPANK